MEYSQELRPFADREPGERVREALGGAGMAPDLGQSGGMELDVPNEPGPVLAGRTPLVGTLRRANGMPVVRDRLAGMASG